MISELNLYFLALGCFQACFLVNAHYIFENGLVIDTIVVPSGPGNDESAARSEETVPEEDADRSVVTFVAWTVRNLT